MSIVGKKIYAGNAKIYKSIWDKRGYKQYFSQDPIYTVISEHKNNLCVRHHSLNKGVTGWFKKDDVCVVENLNALNSDMSRITSFDSVVKRNILDMIKIISEHIDLSEYDASRFERKLNDAKKALDEQEYRDNYLWIRK